MRASNGPIENPVASCSNASMTERTRMQPGKNANNVNGATVKKFDVIRRDKSQPDMVFRGDKR